MPRKRPTRGLKRPTKPTAARKPKKAATRATPAEAAPSRAGRAALETYGLNTPASAEGQPAINFGLKSGRPIGEDVAWGFGYSATAQVPRTTAAGSVDRQYAEILHVMSDADPQLSFALWQWMRLVNNGHQVYAVIDVPMQQQDGSVTVVEEQDPEGQVILDELAKRVGAEYGGGMDQLVGVFTRTLLKEGAVAAEIEVNFDLTDIVDLHPVSPGRIVWLKTRDTNPDGTAGPIHRVLGAQVSTNKIEQVSPDQVRFFPLDPEIENPYGHSPFVSSIQSIYFKAQVLRDLRRVMHVAGNPRIDVSVLYQTALKNVPQAYLQAGRERELQQWINAQIEQIRSDYEKLEPDDGFVHWDHVAVKYVGPGGGGSVNVEQIEKVLNRQIVAGVKMLPILLGTNETSTETRGSIEWQVQVAGIEAVQKIVRRLFEWFYSTALEFYGSTASAKMEFDKHRTVDAMVEATTRQILSNFWLLVTSQGWASADEAAQDLLGHGAVGPDPNVLALQQQVDQLTQALTDTQAQLDAQANANLPPADQVPPADQQPPAAAAKRPASATDPRGVLTPEMAARLRELVREYSRTGDRRALLANLVRLYTKPPEKREGDPVVDGEELAKVMQKYEGGARSAFYDLFPEVRDALKETGYLKEGE